MAPVHEINSYSVASSASSSSSSKMGHISGCRQGSSGHWDTSLHFDFPDISLDNTFFENARKSFLREFRSCLADWDDAKDSNDTWLQTETSLNKRLTPQTESSSNTKMKDNKFAAVVRENGDYEVMMNICELKLKDVKIRITGEKFVVVEGSKDEGKAIRNCRHSPRNFHYQFSLPENVTWDAVSATLSSDGILTITMPPKANTDTHSDICGMESNRHRRLNIIDNINDNNGQKCKVIDIQKAHSSVRTTGNSSDISCQSSLESAIGQDQLITSRKGELKTLRKMKDCSILGVSREEKSIENKTEYLEKDCSFTTSCNQSKAYLSQSPLGEKRQVKETIIPITMEESKDDHTANYSERQIKVSNDSSDTKKVSFNDEDSHYQQRSTNGNVASRRMVESVTNCIGSQPDVCQFSNKKDIDQRVETMQHCILGHRNDELDLTIKTQTLSCDAKYNDLPSNLSSITKSTHLNNTKCIKQKMMSEQESSALTGKQHFMSDNECKETQEKTKSNDENPATETSHQLPEMETKHFPHGDTTQSPNLKSSVHLGIVKKGSFLEESTFFSMRQSVTSTLEEILSKNSMLSENGDLITQYRRYQEDNATECNFLSLTQEENSSLKFVVDVFGLMEQSITVSIVNGKEIRIDGQRSHTKRQHQNKKDFSKTFLLQEGFSVESASASISSDGFLMITTNKESCPQSKANEPRNEDPETVDNVNKIQNVNGLLQESQKQMELPLTDNDQASSIDVMSGRYGNGLTSKASLAISENLSINIKGKSPAQAKNFKTVTPSSGENDARLLNSRDMLNKDWKEESHTNRYEGSIKAVLQNESEANRDKRFITSKDNQSSVQKNESQDNKGVVVTEAAVKEDTEVNTHTRFTDSKDNLESVSKDESVAKIDVGSNEAVVDEESEANTDIVVTNTKDSRESVWKQELEACRYEGFIDTPLKNESEANRYKINNSSEENQFSVQKVESQPNRDVMFIEAAEKEESEANTHTGFTDSKDKLESVSKEESFAERDVRSIEAVTDKESDLDTDVGVTNSKDMQESAWKQEVGASRYEASNDTALENESEANRYKCFTSSQDNHSSVKNDESKANRDVVFIEAVVKEEQAKAHTGFNDSKDMLECVSKNKSVAKGDVGSIKAVIDEESEADTYIGVTNSKDMQKSVCMQELEASRYEGSIDAALENQLEANRYKCFTSSKDNHSYVHNDESQANIYVMSIKPAIKEKSEANTKTRFTDSYDKLESVSKDESVAMRDVGSIIAVIHEESDTDTDIVVTNSKDKLESDWKQELEANEEILFIEDVQEEQSDANRDVAFTKLVLEEESEDTSDVRLIDSKDNTYSVWNKDTKANKDVGFNENSTDEQTEHGYFHPQTHINKNTANITVKEVSEHDTDISERSSTSFKINQQELQKSFTPTDKTNAFLYNNKCTSLKVIKKGSFDVDTFYESARLHFQKGENVSIHEGTSTSVSGDVNKRIICLLEDQENEIVTSLEDEYKYTMFVDVISYLENEIEIEVLSDNKILVKCSSVMNNDGELDHLKDCYRTFDIPTGLEMESGICGLSTDGILAITFNKKVLLDALQVKNSDEVCFTENSEKDKESHNVEERVKLTWEGASNPFDFNGRNLTVSNQDEDIYCSSDIQALTDQIITTGNGLTGEQESLSRDHNKFMEVSCSSDDAHHHYEVGSGQKGKESVNLTSSNNIKHEIHHDYHIDRCKDNDANENSKIMRQKKDVISSLENVISLGIFENQSAFKSVLPAVKNGTMQMPYTDNCISIHVEEKGLFGEDTFFDRARLHFARPVRELTSNAGHFSSETDAHTDFKNLRPAAECNEERISTFAEDEQYYMIILDVGIYTKKTHIDIKVKEQKEVVIEWAFLTNEEGQHLKSFSQRFELPSTIDVESGFSGMSSDGILAITFLKKNQSSGVERSLSQDEVRKVSTLTQTLNRDPNFIQSKGFIITSEGGRNCKSVSDVARWEESSEATGASTLETYYANVRLLPFTKRGLFFHDSFFHEVHTLFQTALNKVLMSTVDQNCENASDIETYHCLRDQNPNLENQAFHTQEDHHSYKVVLDVANLSEESIVVYVVDKKELVIEGQVEKTDTSSSSLQSFKRAFSLPQTTDFIEATATLSSDGVLFVDFSKRIGVQRD
ncbi:uro-adherence factor A-like [Palaemon carinicauda]|uniref:uro-adherence factor A-like n=1 Tax=Palaemon carinicauda TaxID=392227 RepID=UPI0035B66CFC